MKKLQEKADSLKLGLYLHVPFCARSCDFCHFYQEPPKRADLDRYLAGMERALSRSELPRPLNTVFWGGGTPGLLAAKDLERLGRAVLGANGGRRPGEWTVEMAPATVKADKLACLRDLGVNRISMGVQSFQPKLLESLGRIHSLEQVRRSVDLLHDTGMTNFNLDLIFAIPGQDHSSWEADLKEAVAANPAHISTYCLTFEEDTALWLRLQRGQVHKIDDDEEAGFFEIAWDVLEASGYEPYEVSNYARPGHACEHNLATWGMQEWLGIGPSASSQMGGRRWTEPHSLETWLGGLDGADRGRLEEIVLTPEILAEDLLIFGLRMNEGVDLDKLGNRLPGSLPESWPSFMESLVAEGLAEFNNPILKLTMRGRLVADRIGEEILGLD
ncbi:MAG TPA: radical SAM family heme chaperone HemW [Oceanipulchritudo sp.]|nr:radical SAM family heme chaperone HemW [Oceanipulchritudo sp.]